MNNSDDESEYPDEENNRYKYESIIYDQWYSSDNKVERPFYYHNTRNEKDFVRSLIAKHNISIGSSIIDIGCGNGLYANLFAENGLRVTAVDLSKRAIEFAMAKYGSTVNWISGDVFELDYKEYFDYGFCNFFTFFNCNDVPQTGIEYSERIMKYIRPGGVMFFIWISDLTAIRLSPDRFSIMNFTVKQLEALFPGYSIHSYAIDSMSRIPIFLGRYSYNKLITRLSCAVVMLLSSSWRRVRVILAICKK